MREPGIPGVTSIDCLRCGRRLSDYDAPVPWKGILHLTARCHGCRVEHLFEVEATTREPSVVAVSSKALPSAGDPATRR